MSEVVDSTNENENGGVEEAESNSRLTNLKKEGFEGCLGLSLRCD